MDANRIWNIAKYLENIAHHPNVWGSCLEYYHASEFPPRQLRAFCARTSPKAPNIAFQHWADISLLLFSIDIRWVYQPVGAHQELLHILYPTCYCYLDLLTNWCHCSFNLFFHYNCHWKNIKRHLKFQIKRNNFRDFSQKMSGFKLAPSRLNRPPASDDAVASPATKTNFVGEKNLL